MFRLNDNCRCYDETSARCPVHAISLPRNRVWGLVGVDSPHHNAVATGIAGVVSGLSVGPGTPPSPDAVILRVASRDDGMFGVLLLRRTTGLLPFCLTLEDPWKDNRVRESCIPSGLYTCNRVQSPKFGDTFSVVKVPGRSLIRWHWGNTHRDTQGCILLAESFDSVWDDSTAVLASKAAFKRFMAALGGRTSFHLRIEDVWGGSTKLH